MRTASLLESIKHSADVADTGSIDDPAVDNQVQIPTLADRPEKYLSERRVLDVKIINVKIIPRDYLVPDMVKIRAAVRAGQKIAGVIATRETKYI